MYEFFDRRLNTKTQLVLEVLCFHSLLVLFVQGKFSRALTDVEHQNTPNLKEEDKFYEIYELR